MDRLSEKYSDEELLILLDEGESEAFYELYARYKTGLYRYALKLQGNADDAQDALQETFVRLYRGSSSIRNKQALKAWLFQTIRNFIFNQKRNRRTLVPIDGLEPLDTESPHELFEQKELHTAVQAALAKLRPEYREVLLLREYERFSYTEIAALTGATEPAVKARLFKARKALASVIIGIWKEGVTQ